MTNELMEKAKAAKSAEEIFALAKENQYPMDADQAAALFAQLHTAGELSDEELDAVSGGGCKYKGYTVVTCDVKCFTGQFDRNYGVKVHGNKSEWGLIKRTDHHALRLLWAGNCFTEYGCGECSHLAFAGGTGYCDVSK